MVILKFVFTTLKMKYIDLVMVNGIMDYIKKKKMEETNLLLKYQQGKNMAITTGH